MDVNLILNWAGLKDLSLLACRDRFNYALASIVGLQPQCGNVRPYSIKYNVQIPLEPDLRPVTGSHFARPGKSAAAAAIT